MKALVILAGFIFMASPVAYAAVYEYKVISPERPKDFEVELNNLTINGWEVISVLTTNCPGGKTCGFVAVLKREKTENQQSIKITQEDIP